MRSICPLKSMRNSLFILGSFLCLPPHALAHNFGVSGEFPLEWHTDQISRTIATGNMQHAGQVIEVDGKQCLTGSGFSFDVDDDYAFDINETVEVEVEFSLQEVISKIEVSHENGVGQVSTQKTQIPAYQPERRFYKETFTLDRARFINRSLHNADFSVGLNIGEMYETPKPTQSITICNVALKRSYQTPTPKAYGKLHLEVRDEKGRAVPVRVAIYDANGRLPYPSEDAVEVKRGHDPIRVVNPAPGLVPWPVDNFSSFYIDGVYRAALPVGQYELFVSKGPEYRITRQRFDVQKNKTETIEVALERWDDLPAKGWYSGDTHIHYIRNDASDDPNLLAFTQGEDLHVANNLAMGNVTGVPWPQYGWEPVIDVADHSYTFVPGQEDPRTTRLGHTISLRLKEPIRNPQDYMNYRPVFEEARAQGGVTGYAHAWPPRAVPAILGAALDVPEGLVDCFEVMQRGGLGTERWFDYLNLGFKIAPSAGTDYMHNIVLPGVERNYVHIEEPFTLQGWFDGLKQGKTFVTTGPMLEFTINGKPMGSELQLKSGDNIVIEASASINPDIDYLDSLELIEQGDVIKTVKAESADQTELSLRYETTAKHGSWFVVRAAGKEQRTFRLDWFGDGPSKIAVSGAVYIYVDGKSFWKPSAVPSIVEALKGFMAMVINLPPGTIPPPEPWESREQTISLWPSQKLLLQQRIDEVIPFYDDLAERAKAEMAEQ